MGLLRLLESIRFPAMDSIMSAITCLGDELAFMAIAMLVFWCLNKRYGYFIFLVNFTGTVIMLIVKLLVRAPRPWIRDPAFTIVESARASAQDYSFPSGHAMTAAGTFGVLAVTGGRKWIRWLCGILILLVAFSRLYLGVHFFKDVIVGLLVGGILVLLFLHMFTSDERFAVKGIRMLSIMIVFTGILLAFVKLWRFPEDINADYLAAGEKNAYTILGAVIGLAVVYFYDSIYVNFDTRAPFFGQLLKYVLGMAALFGLKVGLKPLLAAAGFTGPIQDTIRYFAMVVFAGCIWPLSFPLFAKVGKVKEAPVCEAAPAEEAAEEAAAEIKEETNDTQEDAQ